MFDDIVMLGPKSGFVILGMGREVWHFELYRVNYPAAFRIICAVSILCLAF